MTIRHKSNDVAEMGSASFGETVSVGINDRNRDQRETCFVVQFVIRETYFRTEGRHGKRIRDHRIGGTGILPVIS
jgi:hypothetical protein